MNDVHLSRLVDYHCHLDLYPDFRKKFEQCASLAIATLAVTTTPSAWPRNKELGTTYPEVRVALGMHPQLVRERASEMVLFEKYVPQTRFVGEVGLDASPTFYHSFDEQKQVFEQVLRLCGKLGGKILSIHSVRSVAQVLQMIEHHLGGSGCRAVLHWFTGSRREMARAVELGCYFSVNIRMLRSSHVLEMIEAIPLARILTETDGPFVQVAGRPGEPSDVADTVVQLARVLKRSESDMRAQVWRNVQELEGLPG